MVWLHWRWNDSAAHIERKAPYDSVDAARAQAEHDLERCRAEDDYTAAPLRITSQPDGGEVLWAAELPG